MGIKFTVHQTPQPKGRKGKKLSHARAMSAGTVKMDHLCKLICARSTISSADVKAVLDSFVWAISLSLKSGQHVELEDLGHFSPSLRSFPIEDSNAMSVRVDSINFRCSEKLKEELRKADLEHIRISKKFTREEREKRMLEYLERNRHISTPDYVELNECSRYQAAADLKWLVEKGIVSRIGSSTHVMYMRSADNKE